MRAVLATQPAWRPSPCTFFLTKLQPLHRHLLEGMRLRHWSSQLGKGQNRSPAYVQTLHHLGHGGGEGRAWSSDWLAGTLGNVSHHSWKHLQGLPRRHPQAEVLIYTANHPWNLIIPFSLLFRSSPHIPFQVNIHTNKLQLHHSIDWFLNMHRTAFLSGWKIVRNNCEDFHLHLYCLSI